MGKMEKLERKRVVVFRDEKAEDKGFALLNAVRMPFAYKDNGQYIITKKQCVILKAQNIGYDVKRYL